MVFFVYRMVAPMCCIVLIVIFCFIIQEKKKKEKVRKEKANFVGRCTYVGLRSSGSLLMST